MGSSSLTRLGTGSSTLDRSNPKKNGAEYLSLPLWLTTLWMVETKKSFVCLMKQSAMFTTIDPGIGLALIQLPCLLSTSSPPQSSCVTNVKHST